MSYLRKSLFWFAALLSAGYASMGYADTKTFTVAPPSSLSVGTQTVSVVFTVTGNSNFNSIELDAGSNLTFNTAVTPTLSAPFTGQRTIFTGTTLQFTNLNPPVKKSITVTLSVTATDPSCSTGTATWGAEGWAGSPSQPSTAFTLTNAPLTSPVNPSCSLSFTGQPANAFVGSVITTVPFTSMATSYVTVQALQGATPVPNVSVSVVNTGPDTCSVSGSATTDANGNAQFKSISSSTASNGNNAQPPTHCQLLTSASGYPSATSGTFDIVTNLGPLACEPSNGSTAGDTTLAGILAAQYGQPPVYGAPPVGSAGFGLIRGINRDGSTCVLVPFTFTVNGDNTAAFTEDSLGQKTSVEYIVRWAPVNVDADNWSAFQPCVSWGIANPVLTRDANGVCYGDYAPAQACLADDVNGPGDGTAVMPTIPNSYPFNGAAAPPSNNPPNNTGVNYPVGSPAKVCVTQQGWNSDNGQVQYWHKFIDQSDTRIVGP